MRSSNWISRLMTSVLHDVSSFVYYVGCDTAGPGGVKETFMCTSNVRLWINTLNRASPWGSPKFLMTTPPPNWWFPQADSTGVSPQGHRSQVTGSLVCQKICQIIAHHSKLMLSLRKVQVTDEWYSKLFSDFFEYSNITSFYLIPFRPTAITKSNPFMETMYLKWSYLGRSAKFYQNETTVLKISLSTMLP